MRTFIVPANAQTMQLMFKKNLIKLVMGIAMMASAGQRVSGGTGLPRRG